MTINNQLIIKSVLIIPRLYVSDNVSFSIGCFYHQEFVQQINCDPQSWLSSGKKDKEQSRERIRLKSLHKWYHSPHSIFIKPCSYMDKIHLPWWTEPTLSGKSRKLLRSLSFTRNGFGPRSVSDDYDDGPNLASVITSGGN